MECLRWMKWCTYELFANKRLFESLARCYWHCNYFAWLTTALWRSSLQPCPCLL